MALRELTNIEFKNAEYRRLGSFFSDGTWTFYRCGRNIWKVYPSNALHCFTIPAQINYTANELAVPFLHRLLRIEMFQTSGVNGGIPGNAAVTVRFNRDVQTVSGIPLYSDEIWWETLTMAGSVEICGFGFEFEASVYDVFVNATNNCRIFIVVYLEDLESWP